jgi:hypothetical protein
MSAERDVRNKTGVAIAVVTAAILAPSAQAASVKEVFEKYNLLGVFAWDCSKPVSPDNNWYHVHRPIDINHVQRDYMTGPTTRQWAAIIDSVTEVKPNELELSGRITGRVGGRDLDNRPTNGVWHVEAGRILQMEATVDGDKVVANGHMTSSGFELPWSNRCGGQ